MKGLVRRTAVEMPTNCAYICRFSSTRDLRGRDNHCLATWLANKSIWHVYIVTLPPYCFQQVVFSIQRVKRPFQCLQLTTRIYKRLLQLLDALRFAFSVYPLGHSILRSPPLSRISTAVVSYHQPKVFSYVLTVLAAGDAFLKRASRFWIALFLSPALSSIGRLWEDAFVSLVAPLGYGKHLKTVFSNLATVPLFTGVRTRTNSPHVRVKLYRD